MGEGEGVAIILGTGKYSGDIGIMPVVDGGLVAGQSEAFDGGVEVIEVATGGIGRGGVFDGKGSGERHGVATAIGEGVVDGDGPGIASTGIDEVAQIEVVGEGEGVAFILGTGEYGSDVGTMPVGDGGLVAGQSEAFDGGV